MPIDNDVFTWHVLLDTPPPKSKDFYHPFRGIHFHITIKYPEDYPHSPPKVSIETPFPHPNIFGIHNFFLSCQAIGYVSICCKIDLLEFTSKDLMKEDGLLLTQLIPFLFNFNLSSLTNTFPRLSPS